MLCTLWDPVVFTSIEYIKLNRLSLRVWHANCVYTICLGITGTMCTTPTNVVEALICLPPLELVVQSEARSAAHRLWSLGCWSYLYPKRGHSSILMWLRQSDPIFNMGVNIMRPAFNPEPQYRVIMLIREDWTKATGAPPVVQGLDWFTDGVQDEGGDQGWSLWALCRKNAQLFHRQICNSFSGWDICYFSLCLRNSISEYIGEIHICSDSQAAFKALKAVRTSPLVHQCQKALNDISTRHAVGLDWVPGHAGVRGNEIADELARGGSALRFLGPKLVLEVSRQDMRKRLDHWLVNQHWAKWRGLGNTQRQAWELVLGPRLGTRAKFLTFIRTQSRV